jgi:AcrR family transcriptional regulator
MDAAGTDEQAPARQRLSAEDRRAAIIAAARVLFARNGFRGTGTSDIAAAAGCSEPVIYKHFASKQALFGAVLEDCTRLMGERFAAATAEGGDLFTAYLRFVRGLMGDPEVAEVARLRYLALTLTSEPEIRAGLSHMMSAWHSGVRAAVEDGRANGRIRAAADVASVSMLFLGLGLAAGFVGALDGEGALACFPQHFDALVDLLTPTQGGSG